MRCPFPVKRRPAWPDLAVAACAPRGANLPWSLLGRVRGCPGLLKKAQADCICALVEGQAIAHGTILLLISMLVAQMQPCGLTYAYRATVCGDLELLSPASQERDRHHLIHFADHDQPGDPFSAGGRFPTSGSLGHRVSSRRFAVFSPH